MTTDARFEDGGERALRLMAIDADDLNVVAALVQDAVLPASEMRWQKSRRRFVCLINRFRWEDKAQAERKGRDFERVMSVLAFDDVLAISQQGMGTRDAETLLSLLTIGFEPGPDGTGRIVLTFAGDGAVALDVEAVNVTLQDVTKPYRAPSGHAPSHSD